jgi:hypothetical protein
MSPVFLAVALVMMLVAPTSLGEVPERPPEAPDPTGHDDAVRKADSPLAPADVAQGEPLLEEVARHLFAPALILEPGPSKLAATGETAYALVDDERLVAFDLASGAFEGELDLEPSWGPHGIGPERLRMLHADGSPLLLVTGEGYWMYPGHLRAFDVSEPGQPELVSAFEVRDPILAELPQQDLAVIAGHGRPPEIWNLRTETKLSSIAGAVPTAMAASGSEDRARLALFHRSAGVRELVVFDVSDPARPSFLGYVRDPDPNGGLVFEARGRFLVHTEPDPAGEGFLARVRDGDRLELLSTIPLPADFEEILLCRGEEGPVLAVARPLSIELHGLADPSAPEELGRVSVTTTAPELEWGVSWWASRTRPHLAVLDRARQQVVVVDVDAEAAVGRFAAKHRIPRELAGADGEHGSELAVLAHLERAEEPKPNGRLVVGGALRVEPYGSVAPRGAYDDVLPTRFERTATVGGRYVVGYADRWTNALLTMDAADGSVVDARRPRFPGEWGDIFIHDMDGAGRFLAVGVDVDFFDTGYSSCYELFELRHGAMTSVDLACQGQDVGEIANLEVRADGLVVATVSDGLLVRAAGGQQAFLPLDTVYRRLELVDGGERALLSHNYFWAYSPGTYTIVSLEDPLAPRVEFTSAPSFTSGASLVRGGKAVITTEGTSYFEYTPRLLDAETGEPLGELGDAASKWFYHGPGIAFGDDRFLYWGWTLFAWWSAVYDVSSGTPRLLGTSPFQHGDPYYLERPGTDQAYLIGPIAWSGGDPERTPLWLVESDGTFTPRGSVRAGSLRPLRPGLLAGTDFRTRRALTVWRDTGLAP